MSLSSVAAPVRFAFRRMRARPLAVAMIALAFAGAGALIGWSSLAAALAQEENVRLRLAELPPDERAIQVVYHRVPFEREGPLDPKETAVSVLTSSFGEVTEPRHRVQIWSPIEEGVRLVVAETPAEDVALASGRLPKGCQRRVCEALALGGHFRPGDRVALGGGTAVLVVGSGSMRPEALPSGPSALAAIADPGDRALLVPSVERPLAPLLRSRQTTVVVTAPLDPESVHGSELRALAGNLRRAIVRAQREDLLEAGAPLELLDDIVDRGEVARARLFLIAGQGAALIIAFAAFAASARRDETRLLVEQLTTLGASRAQVLGSRLVEALVPSLAGAFLALVGLRVAAELIAERRNLPSTFVGLALPFETVFTIGAVAAAGAVLLVTVLAPQRRTRLAVGALEFAALAAVVVVGWQAATTAALDPTRISAGQGASPVVLVLPALAFFATAVVLLRVLPLVLRLAERLARRAPLGVRLAFLTAARTPTRAAAATTFLAVALGAALFSLNYEATLERQARDEAHFKAGAQWRVTERSGEEGHESPDITPLSRFALATTERPTPVLRSQEELREQLRAGASLPVEILAIPSERIPSLLGWRESFSSLTPAEIARRIRPQPVQLSGIRIPPETRGLRVWARGHKTRPSRLATLHFLLPEEQSFVTLRLGLITGEWRRLRVVVPPRLRGASLVGLEFAPTAIPPNGVDPGGFVELGRLEEQRDGQWSALPTLGKWRASDPGGALAGEQAVIAAPFSADAPVAQGIHLDLTSTVLPHIRPAIPFPEALPALVSGPAAAAAVDGAITVDLLGRQVPVRLTGSAKLFPTVIEQPANFIVLDYDTLFAALNVDQPGLAVPGEAWFFQRQSPGFAQRLEQTPFRLETAVGVVPLEERLLKDPLAAGTSNVLGLAAVAAAALALLGLVLATRSALGSERLLLAEYEAMGVPPSTLVRSMQVRLLILSILGVAAGVLGALLAVRMVGAFVAVTGSSTRPLPPIEPVVAWGAIGIVLAAVAVAGLATAAFLAGRSLRETTARRLRA